jgi:predicted nucleic acid-binding Zn finger protein
MALSPIEEKKLSQENLTQKDIDYFRDKYGKKFVRALRVVEEKKVEKYHFKPSDSITWIVKGRARQYLVIPKTYCTCRSFYQEVVISRESDMCYHLLAQQIAEIRSQHELVDSTDTARRKLYVEWRRTD